MTGCRRIFAAYDAQRKAGVFLKTSRGARAFITLFYTTACGASDTRLACDENENFDFLPFPTRFASFADFIPLVRMAMQAVHSADTSRNFFVSQSTRLCPYLHTSGFSHLTLQW